MHRSRSNWPPIIFLAIVLPILMIGLNSREGTSAAFAPLVSTPTLQRAFASPISTTVNANANKNAAVFWDTPPRSSATAFLDQLQVVMPGADDQVRVIVQLRDAPVSQFIRQSFGATRRLNSTQTTAVQQYAATLAARRQQFLAQIRQQGVGYQLKLEYAYLLNGVALSMKMREWQRVSKIAQVKSLFPDYTMRVALNDSVPLIGAPAVWAMTDASGKTVTGQGIRVAIIDTGVDYTHPDLGGCFGPACRVIGGYDFVNQDNDPMDDYGHGTHVAGIVAANGTLKGVAPDAQLLVYKVLDAQGEGKESDIIAALELAANPDGNPATDDGAQVANLSLGGDGDPDDPLCQAVDNATDQGMVVVVAAGNSGSYQSIASPGVARKAITVAASNKFDSLAAFSSRGPIPGFDAILKPDITAPGVNIYSTVPISGALGSLDRYRWLSGTSMATPHIAGAAALLKQLHPTWMPDLIKANLMNPAKDLGLSVYDQGAGRVDLTQTVSSKLVATPGNFSFGIPSISGTTSIRLSITNIATTTITATASILTVLWADSAFSQFFPMIPVTYTQLNVNSVTIPAEATASISVTLNLPENVPEGYYTGAVTFLAGTDRLVVPFTFTMLSRVTLHILDVNGVELNPSINSFSLSAFTLMVRMPNADLKRAGNSLFGPTPFVFYIPSGTYNIHAFMNFWLYDGVIANSKTQLKPFILFGTTTVGRNQSKDVYLSAATAHHTTLNAVDFSGVPVFIARWRTELRYQSAMANYTTGLSVAYSGQTNLTLPPPLPTHFDLYFSELPSQFSMDLASDGYGYTPLYRNFRDLNATKWYSDYGVLGFDWIQNADQAFWFAWHFPTVDANFPNEVGYRRDQVNHYRIKYETPGTIDGYWDLFNSSLSGGDILFYLPIDTWGLIGLFSVGMQRDLFVQGSFTYRYWTDHMFEGRHVEREFFTPDWSKAYTTTIDPNVWFNSAWDLQPVSSQDQAIEFGAGPLYPAVTFDNSASMIRLIYPIFGTGQGNKAVWGSTPVLTITPTSLLTQPISLHEYWSSPSPMRQIPVTSGAFDK